MTRRCSRLLLAPGALALLVVTAAPAQSAAATVPGAPRLVDSIEAPILYLTLGSQTRDLTREPDAGAGAQRRTVQRLLADPAFDAILGGGAARRATTSSTQALGLVRGVLARSSGEIEIALTGVVPGLGQPLLVLRAQLSADEAERMRGVIADPKAGLAAQHRVLDGRQTYAMLGADGREPDGPGQQVELALVGHDLVVANDATAMEELLARDKRTAATRQVLSSDSRFVRLQRRLDVPAGSLVVYGDWQRLGKRLQTEAGDGALGVPSFVLRWSGLGAARGVMASLSGDESDFTGTVLLEFDGAGAGEARQRPRRGDLGIDGWFASALSIPAKTLVRDLPGGGLGGLVLAIDLPDIARRSHRGAELLHHLRDSFKTFGLDFERNVLSRLGARSTAQLLFRPGVGNAPTVTDSIYAVAAKSRKAAGDLFTDLRRAAEQNGMGRLLDGRSRRSVEILELRPHADSAATYVAIHEGSVLVAFDPATIDDCIVEFRKAAKQSTKRDAAVSKVIKEIGGNDVTGLFDLDFTPWFDRIARLLAARNTAIDLSGIPRRHIGYLDLQSVENAKGEGSLVLRICVLSSR